MIYRFSVDYIGYALAQAAVLTVEGTSGKLFEVPLHFLPRDATQSAVMTQ